VVLNEASKNDTSVQPVLIFSTLLIWIQRWAFFQRSIEFLEQIRLSLSPVGHFLTAFFGVFLSDSGQWL
jgi:hypothetical protein